MNLSIAAFQGCWARLLGDKAANFWTDRIKTRMFLAGIFVVFWWLLIGTVVYRSLNNCNVEPTCSVTGEKIMEEVCGWTWEESFYYSVQAGLSIGYGLLHETEDISKLYTICHVLFGSTLAGGALALFVTMAVTRNQEYQDKMDRTLTEHKMRLSSRGYSGLTAAELRLFLVRHPAFYHDLLHRVESDEDAVKVKMAKFNAISPADRRSLVDDLLHKAFEQVEEMRGGELSVDHLKQILEKERSLFAKVRAAVMRHATLISVWTCLWIWVLVGVLFGIYAENWSFITSLYFSVSSMSTGGFEPASRIGSHLLFVGIYDIIGVPLYGAALGTFANTLSDWYAKLKFDDKMDAKMSVKDVEFVEHLLDARQSDTLTLAEFTEIELLRLGLVDRNFLLQTKEKFQRLDRGNTGVVSTEECLAGDEKKILRVRRSRSHAKAKLKMVISMGLAKPLLSDQR